MLDVHQDKLPVIVAHQHIGTCIDDKICKTFKLYCVNNSTIHVLFFQVARTKNRPLACGDISTLDAWMLLGGKLSLALLVLLQLNWYRYVVGQFFYIHVL